MTVRHRLIQALSLSALIATGCATPGPAREPARVHDPSVRFGQMDRVTMQIVRATSDMSEARYQTAVRPQLPARLSRLGFSDQEATLILTRVADARADRARVQIWWAGLDAKPDQHASR